MDLYSNPKYELKLFEHFSEDSSSGDYFRFGFLECRIRKQAAKEEVKSSFEAYTEEMALADAVERISHMKLPLIFDDEEDFWRITFTGSEIRQELTPQMIPASGFDNEEVQNWVYITGKKTEPSIFKLQRTAKGSFYLGTVFYKGSVKGCGNPRQTSIRWSCASDGIEKIVKFAEYSICMYRLHIQTNRLCDHPYLNIEDANTAGESIECRTSSFSTHSADSNSVFIYRYENLECSNDRCYNRMLFP